MQEGIPDTPARVLIADEISSILSTLEKLAPFGELVDPCGMARDSASLLEESHRLQPDVILLNPSIISPDESMTRQRLAEASPRSRVVLIAAEGAVLSPAVERSPEEDLVAADAAGRDILAIIQQVRPREGLPALVAEPIP
ncbi:MAG: hypothetical protein ABR564_08265, partial [Candidatus Dormibacteria bacterium]